MESSGAQAVAFRPTACGVRTPALVGHARRLSGVDDERPAAEELERILVARAGLGDVGEERQAGVCGEVQPVEVQVELADGGMLEVLDAGVWKRTLWTPIGCGTPRSGLRARRTTVGLVG
jgi:hypothetical protein